MNEHLLQGAAVGLLIGYVVGRLDFLVVLTKCRGAEAALTEKPRSFFSQKEETRAAAPIDIDSRKFVGAIRTDDLTKSAETSLGKTTVAQDDIKSSVSKLAQLKGK